MKRSFPALSVCLLLLLLVSAAPSQEKSAPVSEKELKRQRQRLQAISMVKQSAAEATRWDNKKAAVSVLADAAESVRQSLVLGPGATVSGGVGVRLEVGMWLAPAENCCVPTSA